MELDHQKELEIDRFNLDREWTNQPVLYMEYSEKAAEARKRMDEAREHLDVVKAELDKKIRKNPEDFGLSKITESAVVNTILLQPEYSGANDIYLEARHNYDVLSSLVRAFDHRKSALENLVRLHVAGYYSEPKVEFDDDGKDAVLDIRKKAVREKIKSKRTK